MTSKTLATFAPADALPAHLQADGSLGNENVTSENLMLPKIDIIQQMSPQKVKTDAKYIEGAEDGMLFNSLTGELYEQIFVINLAFEVQYSVFRKRNAGGGFEGFFNSESDAMRHIEERQLDPKMHDITETSIHKCLLLDENGHPKQPVLFYMSRSKSRVSNGWNTEIQLKGQGSARFATVWQVGTVRETNRQGQPYHNYRIQFAGFADEALYAEAKKNYYALTGQVAPEAA